MIYTRRGIIYGSEGMLQIEAYLTITNHTFRSTTMFIATDYIHLFFSRLRLKHSRVTWQLERAKPDGINLDLIVETLKSSAKITDRHQHVLNQIRISFFNSDCSVSKFFFIFIPIKQTGYFVTPIIE